MSDTEEKEDQPKAKFTDFDFGPELLDGLSAMGFEHATPVQEQAIPIILKGKDLVACAQTGTGKTAAFLLPVIERIISNPNRNIINTLVIVPTRELAIQIDQQLEGFAYFTPVSSVAVYGGGDGATWDVQKKAFTQGADIIIGTPGRLIAHLEMGYAKLDQLQHLILDEADRMLDMGFYDDIMKIISGMPKDRQTLLFSATMPPKIRELSNTILMEPDQVSLAISKPAAGVLQAAYNVYDPQKNRLLISLLKDKQSLRSIIIFASRKIIVDTLVRELRRSGMNATAIHSNLEQDKREQVLLDYRNRKIQILVATDILSRGIDIKEIDLVINYDVPKDAADYVHRVGRTARAQAKGVALTLINEADQYNFHQIETLIERVIPKSPNPEGIGEGPAYEPTKRRGGGNYRKGGGKGKGSGKWKGKGKGGGNYKGKR